MNQSGFAWDDEKGANIGLESRAVWDAYVDVHGILWHISNMLMKTIEK
jgi:hypothetical protein